MNANKTVTLSRYLCRLQSVRSRHPRELLMPRQVSGFLTRESWQPLQPNPAQRQRAPRPAGRPDPESWERDRPAPLQL